ncbi:hypothetical protein F4860DRAFT_249738 [Xylaria cubensis]|nr:hypothetical protein F4860DRAFT_249738 [Xylaria cubensis]
METSNSLPAPADSQPRKRKGRNSDIRKEQNRIASRAYREKRRQKLALLDEILKSDSHTDSMSSVSDETEYNSTAAAPELRAVESTGKTRLSSDSPAQYYMSAVPALASVPAAAGIHHLPSNGPNHDTEAYASYSVKNYSVQETDRFATQHAGYIDDPNISTIGISSGYVSPLPSVTPMPSTPMFPFDEEFVGDSFSTYPPVDNTALSYPASPGYDTNMINALQSVSRLNDNQQQQIMAYLQKRRSGMQQTATDNPFHPGYSGYQIPVPRSNPVSGHLQSSEDIIQSEKGYHGRYTSKSHR